jgi:hypothetical protein
MKAEARIALRLKFFARLYAKNATHLILRGGKVN